MGWLNHQLELFVVRLLPHIVGVSPHIILCDLKTTGSRSTMNTWAQWNTVTICEDGKRWVSQIGNRHCKKTTKQLLTPLKFTERYRKQTWYFGWWPMDSIRISICFAESVNVRFWPLSSWELTWRYDIQHAVWEQMCGIAQKWLANSWQIMAHHLVAGMSIHSPPMNQFWPERCVSKKDLKRL